MKTPRQIADYLRDNPPDFAGLYGEGTSGEKIAQNTWVDAINSFMELYQEPSELNEEESPGLHPSQRSTE